MEIDANLIKVKPVSQLPTGEPSSVGQFLYYEGDVLQKSPMSNIYDKIIEDTVNEAQIVTVSTDPPSGVPADGQQWIQYVP